MGSLIRLIFAEAAKNDLESIIDYIALDNPIAAEAVYRAIISAGALLNYFPQMGRPGRLPGTRQLTVPGLPYLIAYQINADQLTVLAVFHGARDLAQALRQRQTNLSDSGSTSGKPG